ncbi:MAG: insulinase family protein [Anaplasmataceae bacterium]|nr:insulinase family protein [Anaplasmataceae bacterium]
MFAECTTLDNGLRVVSKKIESFGSIALEVAIDAGSALEDNTNNGVAHFVEHMLFKGTKTRTAKDIACFFDNIGGAFNAFTDRDLTVYHVKVLPNDLDSSMEVLADIIQNSTFDEKELELERGVILQEIAECHDEPSDIIFDKYYENIYSNQYYGRPILGTVNTVKKMTRDDLINFVNRYYVSSNIVITVVGDIEHSNAISYVKKHFINIKKDSVQSKYLPIQYKIADFREERDLQQVHLLLGFEGMNQYDKDRYSLGILSSILGSGMSSRLFQEVREKRGLVYGISSFSSNSIATGEFGIYASLTPDNVAEYLDVVSSELKKMNVVFQEEMTRVKNRLKATLAMKQDSNVFFARYISNMQMRYNEIKSIDEVIEKYNAVTIDDLYESLEILLSKSFSFAAVGKLDTIPSYNEIKNKFIIN